jgi:hypothetical protein
VANNLLLLVATGDVDMAAARVDKGMTVSFTSEKPEVVETLQERVPQWVARAQQQGQAGAGMRRRFEQMREAMGLLAEEAVQIVVEQTETGITVTYTSEDPELAEKIKEVLAEYLSAENQKENATRTLTRAQRRPAQGGPAGQGQGQGRWQGGRGQRGQGRQWRQQQGQ